MNKKYMQQMCYLYSCRISYSEVHQTQSFRRKSSYSIYISLWGEVLMFNIVYRGNAEKEILDSFKLCVTIAYFIVGELL